MNTYRRDTVSDVPSLKVVQAKVWHSNSRQREREEKDEEKCCPRSFGDEDGKEKRFGGIWLLSIHFNMIFLNCRKRKSRGESWFGENKRAGYLRSGTAGGKGIDIEVRFKYL